ncbi:MAG TPA: phosphatase PAP2 family protein [Xanthobacteraceae bacterium]
MNAPNTGFVEESVSRRSPLQRIAHNISENVALCARALIKPARSTKLPQSSGIIVIALALVAAAAVSMPLFDASAVEWARGEPHWFRAAFQEITRLGLSGWFLFPCGFVLLFLAAVTSAQLANSARATLAALGARFGYVFLAIGLPGLFVSIVKRLIGRARPFVGGHEDPFYYAPFTWHPAFASMPSGHATTAVAAAIAIGAIWPRTRIVMWLYAAAIVVSRVAVLAHHPSDVIGGALAALVGTHLLRRWFAARGLVFRANDLGVKPAPSLARVAAALRQAMLVRNPAA